MRLTVAESMLLIESTKRVLTNGRVIHIESVPLPQNNKNLPKV